MILACDPGLSGAFYCAAVVEDMPTYTKTIGGKERRFISERDVFRLVGRCRNAGATRLVIEDVKGAPGQSAPAAFTFGYGYGVVIGAAKTTAEGAVLAYLVDAVTYLFSVVSLGFIRVPFQHEHHEHEDGKEHTLSKDVGEGLRFLWKDGRLRTLALASWALSFLYAPVSLAMIVLARDRLHASARVIGLIFSLSAVGGLIGAWLAPHV